MNKKFIYMLVLTAALVMGFAAMGTVSFAAEPAENTTIEVTVTKGIVNAANLSVRSNPATNYAIVGQLTIGEEVLIYEQSGDWYKVEGKGVAGWVHGAYIKDLNQSKQTVSAAQQVSRGAYSTRGEIKEVPLERITSLGPTVVSAAQSHLGKPYKYGAGGPNSFDCSGLVTYCFNGVGVSLPRSSKDYGNVGTAVSVKDALPGDVVCFNINGKRISHVGIYIGGGDFIHAASGYKTHKVMVNNLSESYYSSRLVTIRRIL